MIRRILINLSFAVKLLLTVLFFILASCGGGGGGDDGGSPDPQTEPESGFEVGGIVTGLMGSGLVLQNNSGNDLNISADGSFAFSESLDDLSDYEVTILSNPTSPNQVCTASNGTGSIAGADISDVIISCITNKYSVGGVVSGLSGAGLAIKNNDGDEFEISENGSFTFATSLDDVSAYEVIVTTQPVSPKQHCVVVNGNNSLSGSDVTTISIDCYLPAAPTLSVDNHSRAVIASWDEIYADNYNVYYSTEQGFDPANYSSYANGEMIADVKPPFTITDLVNDETYYIVVESVYAGEKFASLEQIGEPKEWYFNGVIKEIVKDKNGVLYIGGMFSEISDKERYGISSFNPDGTLREPFVELSREHGNPIVDIMVIHDDVIYFGGDFDSVNGQERKNFAAVDLYGNVTPWDPIVNSRGVALAISNDVFYIGGGFDKVNGRDVYGMAAVDINGDMVPWFNGEIYTPYYSKPFVTVLTVSGNTVYVGGDYSSVNGQYRTCLSAISTTGQLLNWDPEPYSEVYQCTIKSISVNDGIVYVGGWFLKMGDEPRQRVAAINVDGSLNDWSPSSDEQIHDFKFTQDTIYMAGGFEHVNDELRPSFVALDYDGNLKDLNLNLGKDDNVYSLLVDEDKIYVGGSFYGVNGEWRQNFAVVKKDGSLL